MKKVLFPTDFSGHADQALKYAAGFCEALKAELVVLHACHVPALASQVQMEVVTEERILNDATEKITATLNQKFIRDRKLKVEQLVKFGFAVDVIISAAEEINADLIMMGTKGAGGLEEVFLGSNTGSVIERASCPVMAIPENSKFNGFKKMVFATDYRDHDADSISYLARIASLFNSEIITIHVYELDSPAEYENELLKLYKEKILHKVNYPYLSFETIRGYHVDKTLNAFIEENNIDLVALSTKKRNIITKLFNRSLTKKMAYHSDVPLLSFHA